MKTANDAFGQEMWAYFKGKPTHEIVERDDGLIEVSGGPRIYFQDYKDWPDHEKKAVRFAAGRVLDVGAGAGRVSLHLQKKGRDVTAMDNSSLALKICRMRGIRKTRTLPFDKVGKFGKRSFDTVVMFGNNFGLFQGPKKAKSLLKTLYCITSPSALIVAQTTDPYDTKNPAHLSYHRFNRKRGRMAGQARIRIRYQKCVGEWINYLLVSKSELKDILKNTGWKIMRFIDSKGPQYFMILGKSRDLGTV